MQNTYQEKIDNLEANNSPVRKKLEGGIKFKIKSNFQPAGDQPEAIKKILKNLKDKQSEQVLLGVTGSGKTFTMAKVIESANRPALVLAPNKTLAAQLYGEMKSFFPDNAVEYFVSYYDYYTPEAYVPRSDTYIEKEASINEQIDRMRHSATRSLLERDDVIIVASVSCIYGLGSVEAYSKMTLALKKNYEYERDEIIKTFVNLQYKRNDQNFFRGTFRVRGENLEIFPSHLEDRAWRLSLNGNKLEKIEEFDPLTGDKTNDFAVIKLYANSHYITPKPTIDQAIKEIKKDLISKANELKNKGNIILAKRYLNTAQTVTKTIQQNKLDEQNAKIQAEKAKQLEKASSAASGIAQSILTQVGLAGGLAAAFTKFNSLTRAVGENFGAIGMQTPAIKGGLLDASVEATGLGKSISDNIDIVNELTTSFGFGLEESINLSKSILDTSVALGLSNTEGAKLIGTLSQVSGLSLEASDQFAKQTASLAKQEGVSPVAVLKDIAGSSEDIAKFTDSSGENIAKAAIMATKLGTNLGTVAKVAEGLLDFENSITKELEASIMIGRQLNFQKARELALNNDIEGAMADVVSQLGSEEEFTRLNALQRKSLADSIGVGVDELAKFVNNQEKAKTLQDALVGQPFEDLVGDKAIDSISRIVNSFQKIGASLSVSIGPQVAGIAEGLANFVKFLGESKALIPGIVALMTIMAAKSLVTAYASLVTSGLLAGGVGSVAMALKGAAILGGGAAAVTAIASAQEGGITTQEGLVNVHPQEAIVPIEQLGGMINTAMTPVKDEISMLRRDMQSYFGFGGSAGKDIGKSVASNLVG